MTNSGTEIVGDPIVFEWVLESKASSGIDIVPMVCGEEPIIITGKLWLRYCWFNSSDLIVTGAVADSVSVFGHPVPGGTDPAWWPDNCPGQKLAEPWEPPGLPPSLCELPQEEVDPVCLRTEEWNCGPGEERACNAIYWLKSDGQNFALCVIRVGQSVSFGDGIWTNPRIRDLVLELVVPDSDWAFVAAVDPQCGGVDCFLSGWNVDGAWSGTIGSAELLVDKPSILPGGQLSLGVSLSAQVEGSPWWAPQSLVPTSYGIADKNELGILGLVFNVPGGPTTHSMQGPCVADASFWLSTSDQAAHMYEPEESVFVVHDSGACVSVSCEVDQCSESPSPDGEACVARYPGVATASCAGGICPHKPGECTADWMCSDGDIATGDVCTADGSCAHSPADSLGCPPGEVPLCVEWQPVWPFEAGLGGEPSWLCPLSFVAGTMWPPEGGPYAKLGEITFSYVPSNLSDPQFLLRNCGADGSCYWKETQGAAWADAGVSGGEPPGIVIAAVGNFATTTPGLPGAGQLTAAIAAFSEGGTPFSHGHFSEDGQIVGDPVAAAFVVSTLDGEPPAPSSVCLRKAELLNVLPGSHDQKPVSVDYDSQTSTFTTYWPD